MNTANWFLRWLNKSREKRRLAELARNERMRADAHGHQFVNGERCLCNRDLIAYLATPVDENDRKPCPLSTWGKS